MKATLRAARGRLLQLAYALGERGTVAMHDHPWGTEDMRAGAYGRVHVSWKHPVDSMDVHDYHPEGY